MKTLNDYILDAQRKEERFLNPTQKQWDAYATSRNVAQRASEVIKPNYVTPDGIPCHNKATADFYSRNK